MRVKESNREREREREEREREGARRARERGREVYPFKIAKKSDKHVWVLTGMTFKVHI